MNVNHIYHISYQIHHWWIQTEPSAERLAGERQQLEAACGVLPGVVSPFLCRKAPETEKKQKGLLPTLKSPIVCIYSLFLVDILHDLMFFVVHAQASSIRTTERLVVGAQKAICFPKYIT